MTPQEQSALDRAFGRILVKTAQGGFRPLNAASPVPVKVPTSQVSPAAQVKQIDVPVVAPKVETSPLLAALAKTLPTEAAQVKVTQKAAE